MPSPRSHEDTKKTSLASCLRAFVAFAAVAGAVTVLHAQTDLDGFMQQVLATRDDNWRKLQQYVLDEHESIDVRGPARLPIWGDRRDYTWYIRDGFFVRSPLKANGVAVGEDERRKYEADYLKRQQEREKRAQRGQVGVGPSGLVVEPPDDPRSAEPGVALAD